MNPVFSAIGQEIQVGDWVLAANGSYVRQEIGVVTKLGNKNNARVSHSTYGHGGTFMDADGLVVVNDLKNSMPSDRSAKFLQIEEKAKEHYDYTRPKSGNSRKFHVMISPNLKKGWVISFADDTERNSKVATIRDIIGGRYDDRHGYVIRYTKYDRSLSRDSATTRFKLLSRSAQFERKLSMKSVKELGLVDYIDDDSGFDFNEDIELLDSIGKYW